MYGYDKLNRPDYERGFDINLYIWKKKWRLLKKKDITNKNNFCKDLSILQKLNINPI